MLFEDRKDAGKLLGELLKERIREKVDLVLGVPRGGVVVAQEVAKALGAPLSLLIVRKLGVPSNPELAFGAVDPDGNLYLDQFTVSYFRLNQQDIEKVAQEELKKIKERRERFLKGKEPEVKDRTVLVVDDGVATGQTIIAGIGYLRKRGAKKVIVAVPVCPKDTQEKLKNYADEFYCYHAVEGSPFAVGMFYRDFRQVEDEEVEKLLRESAKL